MKRIEFILFSIILLLGIFLRFYQLGNVPIGFHVDEAYFGYNAYSLLKTGKDMTDNFLPLHFASFLFSPAGYSYLTIPWISLFGLSAFSVRFASAFFGSITGIVVFFIAREIIPDIRQKTIVGLTAMFALAVSPWHILLSRTATENVAVVFFLSLGLLSFLLWRKSKIVWYGLGGFASFAVTLLLYQAPRAFLPLFLPLIILLLFWRQKKKIFISVFCYAFLILLPVFLILKSPALSQRITMLSVLRYPGVQLQLDEQIREDGVMHVPVITSRLFHNKIVAYSSQILENYGLHFSYDFLFGNGYFPMRYRVPSVGLLYLIEIPFLLLGIYFILKKDPIIFTILVGWIIIAPFGSALTFDDIPNMQRTLLIFPALSLLEGFGFVQLTKIFQRFKSYIRLLLYLLLAIVLFYSVSYFLYQYYVNGVVHRPWYRQEGTKEMVETVNKLKKNYSYVDVGDADPNLSIFFLLFSTYDPRRFQSLIAEHPELTKGGHYGSISFDKYIFDSDGCPVQEKLLHPTDTSLTVTGKQNVLYVDAGICKIPTTHVKILSVIKKPDNTTAYTVLEYIP